MGKSSQKSLLKALGVSFLVHLVIFLPVFSGYLSGVEFGKRLPNRSVFWTLVPATLATILLDSFYIISVTLSPFATTPEGALFPGLLALWALFFSPLNLVLAPIGALRMRDHRVIESRAQLVDKDTLTAALLLFIIIVVFFVWATELFAFSSIYAFLWAGFIFGKRMPNRSVFWIPIPATAILILLSGFIRLPDIFTYPSQEWEYLATFAFKAAHLLSAILGAFLGKVSKI